MKLLAIHIPKAKTCRTCHCLYLVGRGQTVGMWGPPDHEPHRVRNGLVAPSPLNEMLILVRVFGTVYVLACKVRGQLSCSKWEDNGLLATGKIQRPAIQDGKGSLPTRFFWRLISKNSGPMSFFFDGERRQNERLARLEWEKDEHLYKVGPP